MRVLYLLEHSSSQAKKVFYVGIFSIVYRFIDMLEFAYFDTLNARACPTTGLWLCLFCICRHGQYLPYYTTGFNSRSTYFQWYLIIIIQQKIRTYCTSSNFKDIKAVNVISSMTGRSVYGPITVMVCYASSSKSFIGHHPSPSLAYQCNTHRYSTRLWRILISNYSLS